MKRRVLAGLLILPVALLAGCFGYQAGGQRSSNDLHVWDSTPETPKTVIVSDWSTNEEFLRVDVPVGEKLVCQFHKNKNEKNNPDLPDTMHYRIMPIDQRGGNLTNAMAVPREEHRVTKWYITGKAPPKVATAR